MSPKHCSKLALKILRLSLSLMETLNTVCLTYFADDLLLK